MRIKKTNPKKWRKFRKALREIRSKGPTSFRNETLAISRAIKHQVQSAMIAQLSTWATPPRNDSNPKRNFDAPLDFLLVDTMAYYKSMKVSVGKSNKKAKYIGGKLRKGTTKFVIAPAKGARVAGKTTLSMRDLAYIMEYGNATQKVPGRPLWLHVIKQMRRSMRKVEKRIDKRMGRKFDWVMRRGVWPKGAFENPKYGDYNGVF